jgi:hypothetical protein
MRKLLATAITTLLVASASVMATPASAGSFNLTIGGFGGGWGGYGFGPGIYVQPQQNSWQAHVNWCFANKGPSYNPSSNMYFKNGQWKYCYSPFY